MERLRRLVLWTAMAGFALVFFMKGRGAVEKQASAAFLHHESSCTTIRIAGNLVNPGIYLVPRGADLATVTKMTVPERQADKAFAGLRNRILQDGDVLELNGDVKQGIDITLKKMGAKEMLVLGLPLDPNQMEVDDWQSLPGIGPALASRIVQDRQENGDFGSFRDLERVPGIGKGKINQLAEYF